MGKASEGDEGVEGRFIVTIQWREVFKFLSGGCVRRGVRDPLPLAQWHLRAISRLHGHAASARAERSRVSCAVRRLPLLRMAEGIAAVRV